jgi:transposase-like protein
MGRPSEFTQEVASAICEKIAGGESLRAICAAHDMPDRTTVRRWLSQNEDFRLQYAHAREEQADFYADEIVDIADAATDAQLARLQVDARKWKASKLAPKKYGDKVSHEHTGEGGGPVSVAVKFV